MTHHPFDWYTAHRIRTRPFREVLALMVEGLNSPEIAERLVSQPHRAVALAVQHSLVGSSASDLRFT